jgi:hypothetical protein
MSSLAQEPRPRDPQEVPLRTCPSCHNRVAADNVYCPRCGVGFRAARIRRFLLWAALIALPTWLLIHRLDLRSLLRH